MDAFINTELYKNVICIHRQLMCGLIVESLYSAHQN